MFYNNDLVLLLIIVNNKKIIKEKLGENNASDLETGTTAVQ